MSPLAFSRFNSFFNSFQVIQLDSRRRWIWRWCWWQITWTQVEQRINSVFQVLHLQVVAEVVQMVRRWIKSKTHPAGWRIRVVQEQDKGGSGNGTQAIWTGNTPPVSPPQGNNGGAAGADGFSAFTNTQVVVEQEQLVQVLINQVINRCCWWYRFIFGRFSFLGPTAPSYGTPGPVSNKIQIFCRWWWRWFTDKSKCGNPGSRAVEQVVVEMEHTVLVQELELQELELQTLVVAGGGGAGPATSPFSRSSRRESGIVIIRYKFQ